MTITEGGKRVIFVGRPVVEIAVADSPVQTFLRLLRHLTGINLMGAKAGDDPALWVHQTEAGQDQYWRSRRLQS